MLLVVAALTSTVAVSTAGPASAYGNDQTVFVWGDAPFLGSPGTDPPASLTDIAVMPDGKGYWISRSDGAVYHYGTANWYGDATATHGAAPIVGIARTPTAHGYWLVASDGGVFSFGDAQFRGSAFGLLAGSAVTAIAATPSGNGYWVLASNGGVFAFGDAGFFGSAFGALAGSSATAIAPTRSGDGYWVTAANGGVFTFGDASFFGSAWGSTVAPIVGIAHPGIAAGYYLLDAAGDLYLIGAVDGCTAVTRAVTPHRRAVAIAIPSLYYYDACWVLADNVPANGIIAAPAS